MKTANILLVIFAFIAIGLYTKYLKAMIIHRLGKTQQPAIVTTRNMPNDVFNTREKL